LDSTAMTLGVASPFAREWLEKRYQHLIAATLTELFGCAMAVRFQVLAPADLAPFQGQPVGAPTAPTAGTEEPTPADRRRSNRGHALAGISSLPLNDKYTFETFVIGKSNRLAQAGAAA